MKIDRLLEIIIILLNRETVTAKTLAEHFHVSVRTIQRDMVSISLAGIPLYSLEGKTGGYSILPGFRINSQLMKPEDQELIIKALKSLATSYSNNSLEMLIQKYNLMADKKDGQRIFWDFGVTKENNNVQLLNNQLEKAISEKRMVQFWYRDANGKESQKLVQPLALQYKWYAWYLFSWSFDKKEYRTCKVARIENLLLTDNISGMEHDDIETLMKNSEKDYYQTCISIEIHFKKETIGLINEYFPDCNVECISKDVVGKEEVRGTKEAFDTKKIYREEIGSSGARDYRIFLKVPPKERLWKALLLSLGDQIKVVAPDEYKKELIETAQKFLTNYDI